MRGCLYTYWHQVCTESRTRRSGVSTPGLGSVKLWVYTLQTRDTCVVGCCMRTHGPLPKLLESKVHTWSIYICTPLTFRATSASALRAITNASLARRASRKEVWRATRASRSSLYWHWAGGLGVNFRSPTSFAVIARVPAAAHPCVVSSKRHRQEARVSLRSQSEARVSLRVLLYCGRTRTAASPQRTIGGQWRGVSSSRPSIDSWICTVPVQRTVSPGAVPWGSAAHTGCAGRSRRRRLVSPEPLMSLV